MLQKFPLRWKPNEFDPLQLWFEVHGEEVWDKSTMSCRESFLYQDADLPAQKQNVFTEREWNLLQRRERRVHIYMRQ